MPRAEKSEAASQGYEGELRREVGLPGAVLLGLGSMVGTGVFVSVGIAAGIAGPAIIAATLLAALIATANGLSSAQLASAHPVSGGTYEYGYLWLSPSFGFSAGWMFMLAKSSSAATAALGLSGYLLDLLGVARGGWYVAVAVARALDVTLLPQLLAVAAVAAMAGVLLNLVLGLSRVLLAMARRRDAPRFLSRVDARRGSPVASVWACGLLIAGIALIGNVRTTWSFSAFAVLVYYAITNLAALRLPEEHRLYPRWIPFAGLIGCLGLAFWVEREVWMIGLALLAIGLAGHRLHHRRSATHPHT